MRLTGMGGLSRDHRTEYVDGLVRPNHLHGGGFADNGVFRPLKMDQRIVDHFKAGGPGWQSRLNAALAELVDAREQDA